MDLQLNGSVRDPEMPKMTAVCSKEQGAHGFKSDLVVRIRLTDAQGWRKGVLQPHRC